MRLLSLLLLLALHPSTEPVEIHGTVRDATGLVLPGAAVEVDGTPTAVSNEQGEFAITLAAGSRSKVLVSLPGFDSFESLIDAKPGVTLHVVLPLGRIVDRVDVVARPVPERPGSPLALTPLQAYRTPGAQGDLFRALQAFSGVASPDEGAGLFVFGGDVSEVLVSLDDAVMAHPYRYETPTGGFRGAVDPLLVTGLTFSIGGFSARYGNALSAVVDLHGLEHERRRRRSRRQRSARIVACRSQSSDRAHRLARWRQRRVRRHHDCGNRAAEGRRSRRHFG